MEITEQVILDILNSDYSNITLTTQLYKMFGGDDTAVKSYIKPGREFWHYDEEKKAFRKLKVTYVRTGVMFFNYVDEPDVEYAWFTGSFNAISLYAAQIFPYEVGRLLSVENKDAEKEFPEMCRQCKWGDCDGRIKVDVVWDE